MKKYYTGVGARETPKEILSLMRNISNELVHKKYRLRSGGAEGADTAFEEGLNISFPDSDREIYLPWEGFNGLIPERINDSDWRYVATEFENYERAWEIASEIHPAWNKCSAGAQAMHARNVYQVLGKTLENPSKFLICWSKPKNGELASGGTLTAWKLAGMFSVPRFNLYLDQDYDRVSKLLEK